jgi:hypothetical protein
MVAQRSNRKSWFMGLRSFHGFFGRGTDRAVPAREGPYSRIEFIKKLPRGNEWSGDLATGIEVSFESRRHSSFRQPSVIGSVNC